MSESNNQKPPEKKSRFSQEQYEMLIRCSEKKDMTEWSEWREANPKERILLTGAHLENASFQGVNLEYADLRNAHLEKAKLNSAHLEYADLSFAHLENADFRAAHLEKAELSDAHLENANLLGTHLENANLIFAHLENTALISSHLENADLSFSYIKETDFTGVKFSPKTRCVNMRITDYKGSSLFKKYIDDEQYLYDFKQKHNIIYWLWLISCDCGRSLLRWALWSLALAVGFGLIYYKLGQEAFKITELPWNFSTVVYYSVVTFTTLGFGDVVPKTNGAAWWVMAEVIAGYVMLGGLISIFANKLARRS